MAKIMEQPIVDFLRQQLNFSGFPLPSVSEDENHLIVYEQDSYKQNSELLELFQHASKCNANPDILWTDNADFGKPEFIIINTIIIWLLLLNVSLKLQIIVAKNCEKKESLFEILKLLAGIPWKVLYITPSICLLITM